MAENHTKEKQGEGEEWGAEVVEALCSTDLASMRDCLLDKIVNHKKMELMRSPEVMAFLANKQNPPTVQALSQGSSEKPSDPTTSEKSGGKKASSEKASGDKSRKRTLERIGGERRSLRSRRDVPLDMTSSSLSRGVDSDNSNNADSRTREDRTLPTSRS